MKPWYIIQLLKISFSWILYSSLKITQHIYEAYYMKLLINLPAIIISLVTNDWVLSFYHSNPPLSEEMLPPGEWMCHRCNVRKKVRSDSSLCLIQSFTNNTIMLLLKCRKNISVGIWIDKSVSWSLFVTVRSESRSQNRPTAYQRGLRLSALLPQLLSWSSMLVHCDSMVCLQGLEQLGLVFAWHRCASWTAGPTADQAADPVRPPPTPRPPQPPQRSKMMWRRRVQTKRMKFRVPSLKVLHCPLQHHASSRGPFSC